MLKITQPQILIKLKNSNCDKTQKVNLKKIKKKNQVETKLKKTVYKNNLKNSNCDSDTQIVTNSKTKNVTKFKN